MSLGAGVSIIAALHFELCQFETCHGGLQRTVCNNPAEPCSPNRAIRLVNAGSAGANLLASWRAPASSVIAGGTEKTSHPGLTWGLFALAPPNSSFRTVLYVANWIPARLQLPPHGRPVHPDPAEGQARSCDEGLADTRKSRCGSVRLE